MTALADSASLPFAKLVRFDRMIVEMNLTAKRKNTTLAAGSDFLFQIVYCVQPHSINQLL